MLSNYLEITYNNLSAQFHLEPCGILPFCNSKIFTHEITQYEKLTSGEDVEDVYEITIDLQDVDHDFYPGDAIGILPHNNLEEIDKIMELMDLKDTNYSLSVRKNTTKKKAAIPAHIPHEGSVKHLFERVLDLRSIPKKGMLKMLAQFATNQDEKDELLMHSGSKSDTYNSFISKKGSTLLKLLKKFPSCKPSLECLLEHLPALKPRFYSISNYSKKTIAITFSVVVDITDKKPTSESEALKGVCTSYLEELIISNFKRKEIQFYFRQSTDFLKFEPDFNHPIILIGAGTGIAPFRGFLQQLKMNKSNRTYLFFGCRYQERDFLYRQEFEELVESGIINKLFVAVSRESKAKIYVQDKIRENGELITELLLNENSHVRVCGHARNMFQAVADALKHVLNQYGKRDSGECDDFLTEITKSGRYRLDMWV